MNHDDFLRRRKDRACAIILTILDKELVGPTDKPVKDRLRKVILDQFNDYHNAATDIMKSLDTGTIVVNDLWLERLDAIYEKVVKNGVS